MRRIKHSEKVWGVEGFLSSPECDEIMLLSEMAGYSEAEVSLPGGSKMMKGVRNNYRLISEDPLLAVRLWDKLAEFVPKKIGKSEVVGLNERFRFYRYEADQRFKRHIDGRVRTEDGRASRITFLVYLNDDFTGGETAFDDVTITPRKGDALLFFHELKHEGKTLIEGTKYVLRSDVMYRRKPH